MEERIVYRVGAWGAIIGGILAILVNVFRQGRSSDAVSHLRSTVDMAATSGRWELTMVGIIVASLLLLLAFFALTQSVDDSRASAWGRLAWVTALVGTTIGIAYHAIYTGLQRGAEVMRAEALDSVALVGDGLYSAWAITLFGATALFYGLAMATSSRYPTWLGWVTVAGGVAGLVTGFMHAFAGVTSTSRLLFAISAGVFSLVVLYVGVLLLRRSSTSVALTANEA